MLARSNSTILSLRSPSEKALTTKKTSLFQLLIAICAVMLSLFITSQAFSQTYGPPNIEYNGVLYNYQSAGTDPDGNPCDIYNARFWVDSGGGLHDTGGTYYGPSFDYVNGGDWGGAFAVAADGVSILGVPNGLVVLGYDGTIAGFVTSTFSNYPIPLFSNGTTEVAKYFPTGPMYFWAGSSPVYWYNGDTTSDFVVDARNGWPASNVFGGSPPQQVYINGQLCNLYTTSLNVNNAGSNSSATLSYYYQNAAGDTWAQIGLYSLGGSNVSASAGGSISLSLHGAYLGSSSIDPLTWQVGTLPSNVAISFDGASSGGPSQGPVLVSWDDNLLQFYYTTQDGKDLYWATGDANGDYTVIVWAGRLCGGAAWE